jgi:hypothetical protein
MANFLRNQSFECHISVKTEPLELLYVPPFSYIVFIDQSMLILRQKKKRVPTLSVIFW